jgi:hypothetical protein
MFVAWYLFVMPDIVLLLFHFQFLLSNPPSTATGISIFTDKLSIYTSNMGLLAMHYFSFPFCL